MVTHARGLVCLCLTEERCDELGLRQMTDQNETPFGTAFTVSVEAREGVTTGISAHDRSRTIQVAIDPTLEAGATSSSPVTSSRCAPATGGVLERSGQTEAAVDLARLAGLNPAGVVCEIMKDDGTMARVPDLVPVLRGAQVYDRGSVRDSRGGQLHGHARARPRLPLPDRGALRRARPAPDDRPERDAVRDRLHRHGRGARGRHDGDLRADRSRRSRWRSTRARSRPTSSSPATSFRSAPAPAACCSARARPRPPSTSPGSPA